MEKSKKNASRRHLRVLVFSAVLCALTVILAQYASIKIGSSIRIGFGSLPIFLAGLLFGPWVGLAVGLVGDLVGCAMYYGLGSLIPLVTLGMMAEGFLAGILGKKLTAFSVTFSTFLAHIVGSLILKSLGLWLRYSMPLETLGVRALAVLAEACLMSACLVALLCTSSAVKKAVRRMLQ